MLGMGGLTHLLSNREADKVKVFMALAALIKDKKLNKQNKDLYIYKRQIEN